MLIVQTAIEIPHANLCASEVSLMECGHSGDFLLFVCWCHRLFRWWPSCAEIRHSDSHHCAEFQLICHGGRRPRGVVTCVCGCSCFPAVSMTGRLRMDRGRPRMAGFSSEVVYG